MYNSFEEAEAACYGYWYGESPDLEQALSIAKHCYETYPDHHNQLILDLIALHGALDNVEEAKRMMHIGYQKELWYPDVFLSGFWYKDDYIEERRIWTEMRDQSLATAKVDYKQISRESRKGGEQYLNKLIKLIFHELFLHHQLVQRVLAPT